MQVALSGDALFSQVLMQRQVDKRLFLLVEGNDEVSILTGHIEERNLALVAFGGGKRALLRAGELLHTNGLTHTLVLVDRDLDDLTGKSGLYPPTVVATNGYDLVGDVIVTHPHLLRRAVQSHGGAVVSTIGSSSNGNVSEITFRLAMALAILRLINEELDLGLKLRNFPFRDILNPDFTVKDFAEILDRANNRSPVVVQLDDIRHLLTSAVNRINEDPRHCGGHDILGAAAAVLRQGGARGVGSDQLAASINTAASCTTMMRLSIYSNIENWAAQWSVMAFDCLQV
ncbi:MAG: hypothetical protein WA090_00265 [Candidatus Nanopelagicaceae bacterium]